VLSEEEFKKLHELKTEDAPPRIGRMIEIAGSRAYLSLPPQAEKLPPRAAVIVIHEWWGLNEHVMHFADRIALEGYSVVAVDLYSGTVATTPDDAMKAMKAVDDKAAREKLLQACAFLALNLKAEIQ
jgi:carboxymethylenebutenolidase